MEALDKIDPSLGAAIKTIHPENIEFGESLKLRKYLFSGKISMGSIQQFTRESNYNSYSDKIEYSTTWRDVQYFYGVDFTNYVGWLICNGDFDYVDCFKEHISDIYQKYSIEANTVSGLYTVDPSDNPKKKIFPLKDKDVVALNLAYSFGEKIVWQTTKTFVEAFRCGTVSLYSYECTETEECIELPIYPIFVSLQDGSKAPIGAYLATQQKIHIQCYGKEKKLNEIKPTILMEQRKRKRKRCLQLGLKIAGGLLLAAAAIVLVLVLLP